jgi:hypothetical protein
MIKEYKPSQVELYICIQLPMNWKKIIMAKPLNTLVFLSCVHHAKLLEDLEEEVTKFYKFLHVLKIK